MKGFGLYLTNNKLKRQTAAERGIPTMTRCDEGFPEDVQYGRYVEPALEHYLKACSDFYEQPIDSLNVAVSKLHASLVGVYEFMAQRIDLAYATLACAVT